VLFGNLKTGNAAFGHCIQVINACRSAGVLSSQLPPVGCRGLRPLPLLAGVTRTRDLLLGWCGSPTNTPVKARQICAWLGYEGKVPLPAAVWLFGSALLGLTAIRRRPAAQ